MPFAEPASKLTSVHMGGGNSRPAAWLLYRACKTLC